MPAFSVGSKSSPPCRQPWRHWRALCFTRRGGQPRTRKRLVSRSGPVACRHRIVPDREADM